MKYEKWPLEYKYKDLEPYIDKKTVCIHYTKHLQTYVDKLNKAIEEERYSEFKKERLDMLKTYDKWG